MNNTPERGNPAGGGTSRIRRGRKMGGLVARHAGREAINAAMSPLRSPEKEAASREAAILRLADDIAVTTAGMRGAAQKLGQLIGTFGVGITNRDTREEFLRRLAPLYDSVPKWDDAAMDATMRRSLGARYGEIDSLEGPVAAASIGQVYRGTLRDGRAVAVKVKYPNVDVMVRADLKNLRMLAKIASKYMVAANASLLVEEVIRQLTRELDFAGECANQRGFALRYAGHPAFVVPDVVPELCTDEVLVSEWLDAMSFDDACSLPQAQRNRIGEAVYRFYCGEMYRIGRFVADPHPGNVLVLPDGRVGFVDFGLCIALTPAELSLEREVITALLNGDRQAAYDAAVRTGFIVDQDRVEAEGFVDYIGDVVGWHVVEGERQITQGLAARSAATALTLQGGHSRAISGQVLVEAHAFGRRNELATCALLGRLGATGRWSDLLAEVVSLRGPTTPLGAEIAEWAAR